MKTDGVTGEHVEIEIRRAFFRMNTTVFMDTFPWRSTLAAAGLSFLAASIGSFNGILVMMVVACPIVVLERVNTSDFVTRSRIVRQRGILGGSRLEIPLQDLEIVHVIRPSRMEMPGVRDLEVRSATRGVTFLGVADADRISSRILALRDAVAETRKTA